MTNIEEIKTRIRDQIANEVEDALDNLLRYNEISMEVLDGINLDELDELQTAPALDDVLSFMRTHVTTLEMQRRKLADIITDLQAFDRDCSIMIAEITDKIETLEADS